MDSTAVHAMAAMTPERSLLALGSPPHCARPVSQSRVAALIAAGRREDARALAGFIPDCVVLVSRLARDRRISRPRSAALFLVLGYLALPIDLVPDFLPGIGQLDDAVLLGLALRLVVRGGGGELVREAWPGPAGVARRSSCALRACETNGAATPRDYASADEHPRAGPGRREDGDEGRRARARRRAAHDRQRPPAGGEGGQGRRGRRAAARAQAPARGRRGAPRGRPRPSRRRPRRPRRS